MKTKKKTDRSPWYTSLVDVTSVISVSWLSAGE